MGSKLSKRSSSSSSAIPLASTNNGSSSGSGSGSGSGSVANGDLKLYIAACKQDPDVQMFDLKLREHASSVISSLAGSSLAAPGELASSVISSLAGSSLAAPAGNSLSFESLSQVAGCLMDMNHDVSKFILECKRDVWKNKELLSLVEDYFDYTIKTLDFFTSLDNCLRNARARQFIIESALRHFDQELQVQDDDEYAKFANTLEELRTFKQAGDPFGNEFFALFGLVRNQQIQMLNRLQLKKHKLDNKLKSVKGYRKVSSIIFVATFVAVVICSVVAAAVAAPPLAAALAAAAAAPVGGVGKWVNSLWKKYERELRIQRELITNMQIATYITVKDLDNIRILVDKLEIQIESLMSNAEFAIANAETLRLVIDEIRKKLNVLMEGIDNLIAHSDKYSREIRQARTVILHRIIKYPSAPPDY